MGDAYTPGLTVTRGATVKKLRRLPLAGDVLVAVGDRTTARTVVARTQLPGKVALVNLASALGVLPDELAGKIAVEVGATVTRGQVLARSTSLFGWITHTATSPVDGTLESVSTVTGMAVVREPATPVEVTAYIDGTVVEVIANEAVVIETRGALVQGIFGLAGERHGAIAVLGDQLGPEHRGKVVVAGGRVTLTLMRRAIELGVAAIVCGSFAYQDIRELLGRDVGVAVTGNEPLGTTLVVTEGFGELAMAKPTYELLASLEGMFASVDGATQIRAGVIRPEVIVPGIEGAAERVVRGLEVGAPVRCVRAPYFGRIGKVVALPVELAALPTETSVRVVEVDLGDAKVIVPRANVEVIEA
jgi:hypothetical protein